MMKVAQSAVLALLLAAGAASAESPCVECIKAAQAALASCLQGATTDAAKKACNDAGAARALNCNNTVCKR
jgi:hypothetical protein